MNKINTSGLTPDWRTQETFERYLAIRNSRKDIGVCYLCEAEPIETFTHWKLIPNEFPYDRVAGKHHMLIPKRHTAGKDLTGLEEKELEELKATVLNGPYNYFLQTFTKQMSIPQHLHYHLLGDLTY